MRLIYIIFIYVYALFSHQMFKKIEHFYSLQLIWFLQSDEHIAKLLVDFIEITIFLFIILLLRIIDYSTAMYRFD